MENLYLYLGIYILIILGISLWISKKNSNEDFLIAGRNRSAFEIMSSKFATAIGAAWFITYTGYTYLYGFSVLSILPGFIISYLLYAYWVVPKLYKDSKKEKFYTLGDFVLSKTNKMFDKKLIDIIAIIISFLWLLIGIIGGAKVITFLGILSYEGSLLLTSFVVLIYILLSGFRAVIITDIIQSILIIGLLGFVVYSLGNIGNFSEILSETTGEMSIGATIGFFIYGIFSLFALPDRAQLTFSAKSENDAKKGLAIAIIPIILMIFLLLVIGLYVHSINPNLDADLVFVKFFFDYLPEGFATIGALLFLVGLMSSADTGVYNITSYLAFLNGKEGNKIKQIRILIILLMLFVGVIAYFFRDIIGITVLGAGITLIPSVAMIYIIGGGINSRRFLALILGGVLGLVIGLFVVGLTVSIAVFPILFSLLGFFIDSKIYKKIF